MNILEILIKLRDDIKLWVTNNILALKQEIESDLGDLSDNIDSILDDYATKEYVNDMLDGKAIKYLTTAEFEELSLEEKNRDDIVYQITDAKLSFEDIDDVPDFATKEYVDQRGFSGDYNDLTNKPCYDISNTEEKLILFDGKTDGLESVGSGAVANFKISDEIVYKDDLIGGTINTNGNISTIVEKDIVEPNIFQSGEAFSYNGILFVQEDVVTSDNNTLSAGVWVTSTTNIFTINYSKTATSFKQLDEKFIPDTIARTDHIHNYNDLADKPVKILNGFTTPVNLKELLQTEMYGAYIINGYFSYSNGSGAASYAPSKYFVRTVPGVESIAGTVYFDNMYVVYDANWNYTVHSYATNTKINEIESKLNNKANKSDVPNIVVLTQEEYDDLETAGTVNPDTYYLINEEE